MPITVEKALVPIFERWTKIGNQLCRDLCQDLPVFTIATLVTYVAVPKLMSLMETHFQVKVYDFQKTDRPKAYTKLVCVAGFLSSVANGICDIQFPRSTLYNMACRIASCVGLSAVGYYFTFNEDDHREMDWRLALVLTVLMSKLPGLTSALMNSRPVLEVSKKIAHQWIKDFPIVTIAAVVTYVTAPYMIKKLDSSLEEKKITDRTKSYTKLVAMTGSLHSVASVMSRILLGDNTLYSKIADAVSHVGLSFLGANFLELDMRWSSILAASFALNGLCQLSPKVINLNAILELGTKIGNQLLQDFPIFATAAIVTLFVVRELAKRKKPNGDSIDSRNAEVFNDYLTKLNAHNENMIKLTRVYMKLAFVAGTLCSVANGISEIQFPGSALYNMASRIAGGLGLSAIGYYFTFKDGVYERELYWRLFALTILVGQLPNVVSAFSKVRLTS